MRLLTRLRYQLILSHFVAIAATLLSMVAALVLVAAGWITSQQEAVAGPTAEARTVAGAVGGLVRAGSASAELDPVLHALASGDLRIADASFPPAMERARWTSWPGSTSQDVAYIVVVAPDGRTLGSSERDGAAFDPPERPEWQAIAQEALSGQLDPGQLLLERQGEEPAALGAYPVTDAANRPLAAVVVATRTTPQGGQIGLWRGLVFVGAASLGALALASLFAVIPASILGYALSRRLVARLERLGRAAERLAAGDLSSRVDEGPFDEVGQLGRRFNFMAAKLAAAVAELEAAKEATEATLRAKRELVVNVSHELRTPIALIRGHVESLLLRG